MELLKTLLAVVLLTLPLPSQAKQTAATEQTLLFATCLGRYSAVMEHAWLMGEEDRDAITRRSLFEDLLTAVQPASSLSGPQVLDARIRAKHVLAQRLQAAAFHDRPAIKRRAMAQVVQILRPCQALLLS